MPSRMSWASVALAAVLVAAIALWATGRLELHWRPVGPTSGRGDDHAQDDKEEKSHAEEEGRVHGDKAILDTDAVKAAGLRSEPVRRGSIAVAIETSGEIHVPDDRVAHVTPRVSGVVRDVHKARGEVVSAGTALAVIESAELGEARAAYDAAGAEVKLAEANVQAWRARAQGTSTPDGSSPVGWLELDQALAEHAAAATETSVADRNVNRMKELHERGLRSRTELLGAEADLARARARSATAERRISVLGAMADNEAARSRQRLNAAQARLRALGGDPTAGGDRSDARVVIRSPIAGIVAARELTVGQTVEATSKIYSIADLSELWVTAALYDTHITAVREGQAAVVRLQGRGDAIFKGRVIQVGPHVDEKSRTLPVRVAVRNQKAGNGFALRPGMFAEVAFETSRKGNVVVVPASAVQSLGGNSVVFVETPLSEGAAYQRRVVRIGGRDSDLVEIVEGLAEGDRVVVANAFLLKSEFERSKIGHGHAH